MRHFAILLAAVVLAADTAPAADTLKPRRPLQDLVDGVEIVAKDAWAWTTSPLRMDRESALITGGVLAVGGLLLAFDPEIVDFFQRNTNEPGFDEARRLGETFGEFGLQGPTTRYYVGMVVAGYAIDRPWLLRMGAEILQTQYTLNLLRGVIIAGFGRSRPKEDRGAYHFAAGGGTSLPSGHAANIWSVAEVVRLHVDRWWATAALYTIATSVSLQRLPADEHWASDVWIGSVLGVATARFMFRRHEEDGDRPAGIGAVIAPDGAPGLGYRRGF